MSARAETGQPAEDPHISSGENIAFSSAWFHILRRFAPPSVLVARAYGCTALVDEPDDDVDDLRRVRGTTHDGPSWPGRVMWAGTAASEYGGGG